MIRGLPREPPESSSGGASLRRDQNLQHHSNQVRFTGCIFETRDHLMETTTYVDPAGLRNSDEDDVDSNDDELSYTSISILRLQHRAKFSIARWDKKLRMGEVIQKKGVIWCTTGIVRVSKTFCLLEEIMYLAEIGAMLLLDDDDKQLQLKDIYSLAADKIYGCSWKVFDVYKHLKALGYIVGRHGISWTMKGNTGSCTSLVSSVSSENESRPNHEEQQSVNFTLADIFVSMDITSDDALKVHFDVYLPKKHFKKSAPGDPCFMLYVAGEFPPTVAQLEKLQGQCGNNPLKFAHVDQGRVSIFSYEKVELMTLP